jgi:nitrogen regulatory protein PII
MADNIKCYFKLNIVIVKHGLGSKVVSIAKESGISGGTVIFGKGTNRSSFLKFLELSDIRKEIILVLSNGNNGVTFLENVSRKLNFEKPDSGIAFSIPVGQVYGTQNCIGTEQTNMGEGEFLNLFNSVFVIVDKGQANEVVAAAQKAGAKGATIINGRGSGIHETSKLFAFEIEPEKEIVLILVERTITPKVCESINKQIKLDEPGKGIMFIQSVDEIYGLR